MRFPADEVDALLSFSSLPLSFPFLSFSFCLVACRFISFHFHYLVLISMFRVVDLHTASLQRNSRASNNLIFCACHAYCHCHTNIDSCHIFRLSPLLPSFSPSSWPEQAIGTASQSSGGRTTSPSEVGILPEGYAGCSGERGWV